LFYRFNHLFVTMRWLPRTLNSHLCARTGEKYPSATLQQSLEIAAHRNGFTAPVWISAEDMQALGTSLKEGASGTLFPPASVLYNADETNDPQRLVAPWLYRCPLCPSSQPLWDCRTDVGHLREHILSRPNASPHLISPTLFLSPSSLRKCPVCQHIWCLTKEATHSHAERGACLGCNRYVKQSDAPIVRNGLTNAAYPEYIQAFLHSVAEEKGWSSPYWITLSQLLFFRPILGLKEGERSVALPLPARECRSLLLFHAEQTTEPSVVHQHASEVREQKSTQFASASLGKSQCVDISKQRRQGRKFLSF